MKSIYRQTLDILRSGSKAVLATVVRTSGSTPQKPGSSALFGEKGLVAGTVGGGIMENEVEHIARSVLISGISDTYFFDLDDEPDAEGAICGGQALVLVDANPNRMAAVQEEIERSFSNREPGWLLTSVGYRQGESRNIEYKWIPDPVDSPDESGPENRILKIARDQQAKDPHSPFIELDEPIVSPEQVEMSFLERINPLPRLVIAGAGHIGKALAHLGSLLEFEVTVIDDRAEYANRGNVPDADHLIVDEVGKAIRELSPDPDTFIAIVTRGHHHDSDALKACLETEAAYVGMIGSGKKVATLKKQYLSNGWATPEQWSKIDAPIGLPIGSKTVQEIAVSIAAQLVAVRNKK